MSKIMNSLAESEAYKPATLHTDSLRDIYGAKRPQGDSLCVNTTTYTIYVSDKY